MVSSEVKTVPPKEIKRFFQNISNPVNDVVCMEVSLVIKYSL